MYNFSEISIITHVRLDTTERLRNFFIRENYYRSQCTQIEFVYVEDDTKETLKDHFDDYPGRKYQFVYNDDEFKKTSSYNIGAKLATRKYFCFLDLDCIIHPSQILESVEKLKGDENLGLILPYNGVALYLNDDAKHLFVDHHQSYEILEDMFPKSFDVYYKNDFLLVGNNQAVGGAVMARKENFEKYNGFNPNFQGWGFEDNELPRRVHKLGMGVVKLANIAHVLWHLPHEGKGASNKEHNPYYRKNNQVCTYVEQCSVEDLKEYIKQW